MKMQELAPELLIRIFESLSSVKDIINLTVTCRYFHQLLPKSHLLSLFFSVIDEEMGPLEDVLLLLTQNDNQSLLSKRTPSPSYALLIQVMGVARVAQRFVTLYPSLRWTGEQSSGRRFLHHIEARKLRGAVYKLWGYTQAFHGQTSVRSLLPDNIAMAERLQLLRSWSTDDLYDLEDFRCSLEQLLATEICPTDGEVLSRLSSESLGLYNPSHFRLQLVAAVTMHNASFYSSRDADVLQINKSSVPELRHKLMQGWGSELSSYYLLQAFLKLTPAQILWLYDHAVSKADVEKYIESQTFDPCFLDTGSMLFHDWMVVLHGRGIDVQEARGSILDGQLGIAID